MNDASRQEIQEKQRDILISLVSSIIDKGIVPGRFFVSSSRNRRYQTQDEYNADRLKDTKVPKDFLELYFYDPKDDYTTLCKNNSRIINMENIDEVRNYIPSSKAGAFFKQFYELIYQNDILYWEKFRLRWKLLAGILLTATGFAMFMTDAADLRSMGDESTAGAIIMIGAGIIWSAFSLYFYIKMFSKKYSYLFIGLIIVIITLLITLPQPLSYILSGLAAFVYGLKAKKKIDQAKTRVHQSKEKHVALKKFDKEYIKHLYGLNTAFWYLYLRYILRGGP